MVNFGGWILYASTLRSRLRLFTIIARISKSFDIERKEKKIEKFAKLRVLFHRIILESSNCFSCTTARTGGRASIDYFLEIFITYGSVTFRL